MDLEIKRQEVEEVIDKFNQQANSIAHQDFEKSKHWAEQALQIANEINDVHRQAKAYHNLGIAYFFHKENDKAFAYYSKALELLETSDDLLSKSAALHNIGLIYYDWCEFSKAIQVHKQALDIRQKAKEEHMIILSLDYIGICYLALNDHEKALTYYLEAYKKKLKLQPQGDILRSLFNIGQVYISQYSYEKAKEYLSEGLQVAIQTNNTIWSAYFYSSLGTCEQNLNNNLEAIKLFNKGLEIFDSANDIRGKSITYDGMAESYANLEKLEKSLEFHEKALKIVKELKLSREIAISMRNIAEIQKKMKRYDASEKMLLDGLELIRQINDKPILNTFYHSLSLFYATQKEFQKAYEYQQKSAQLVQEIDREEKKETIAKLKVEFDLERKEREAELHKLKNVTLVEANRKLKQREEQLEDLNNSLEKRVQEELKKREKQQQMLIQKSKLESLGKLAAGIAHELNQPLSGISMGLENIYFAHTEKRLSEEYLSNKLEIIDGYFDRIQKIIDHVRIFSREQKSVQIENIDINEVVKNALSLVETQYKNHNVRLQLKLADSLAKIQGNKYKLEQVFLNLLTNAKDAITEKEEKSEESYRKEIEIKTFENAEKVIFQIQDNGMGIPENVKENLFDPFFTTKEPAKGTGLGLSIVYGIIKEMKAEILVESVLGKGTTFIIEFEKI